MHRMYFRSCFSTLPETPDEAQLKLIIEASTFDGVNAQAHSYIVFFEDGLESPDSRLNARAALS
jgi:hypothetical protein